LFICRGILRAHGGDATLEVAPQGGTILRIRLPRRQR
jgi:signal transduction histidine kinase